MINLTDALLSLSQRERWLVGLLFGGVLPLGIVFLILVPLWEQRQEAYRALNDAEGVLQWVQEQARHYPAPAGQEQSTQDRPAPGLSGLEASLVAAGLRDQVTALTNRRAGSVELRFDSVSFARLMPWLTQAETTSGYRLTGMTLDRTETDGRVAAALTLEPAS